MTFFGSDGFRRPQSAFGVAAALPAEFVHEGVVLPGEQIREETDADGVVVGKCRRFLAGPVAEHWIAALQQRKELLGAALRTVGDEQQFGAIVRYRA